LPWLAGRLGGCVVIGRFRALGLAYFALADALRIAARTQQAVRRGR